MHIARNLKEQSKWGTLVSIMLVFYVLGGSEFFMGALGYTLWVKWDEIKKFFINIQHCKCKEGNSIN